MLKLFISGAWRALLKDKLTTGIQLLGLIIGLSCFVLINQYVDYQNSFNTQFKDASSIYRVDLFRDSNPPQALTPLGLAEALKSNFAAISDATRVSMTMVSVKKAQDVYAERPLFVDSNYFEFFDFELLEGDIHSALVAPDSLVLHESLAVKYFAKSTGVIGQRLLVNGKAHQVTAVIKDSNAPNTMPKTMLLPIERFFGLLPNPNWVEQWNFNAGITFVKIKPGLANQQLVNDVSDYFSKRTVGLSSYKSYKVKFESLLTLYLDANTTRSLTPPGSKTMVQSFQFIALLILFLACVNFTNLATAAALKRGKSVAVAKALGATRLSLILQYLTEAIVLTSIATLLAVAVIWLVQPLFNAMMNTSMQFVLSATSLLELVALTLLVGVIAGSYPAFFLSSLAPAKVLKGEVDSSRFGNWFRKALIVGQFAIAAFLLVASLIVNWQMQHVQSMEQGYQRDNVIIANRGAEVYNQFKTQAIRHPDVESVTMSHTVPTKATRTSNMVRRSDNMSNEIWVGSNPVSYDYFTTFGIKVLSGRVFSKAYSNDAYAENKQDISLSTGKLIINETLARRLGWAPSEAINQTLQLGNINDGLHAHQVVGVVEDSHYTSVKNAVPPMIYVLSGEPQDLSLRWTAIKFKPSADQSSVSQVERIWLSLSQNSAFKYDWLSDLFNAAYLNESQQMTLLNAFSWLAILITVIGLFGIAAFSTQRRVKEIAIRKVLGATTVQLCGSLVGQFLLLVALANILILPVSWWVMRDWLNGYLYRIDLPYSAFVIAITLTITVAFLTVIGIALKAAQSKPIDSLQYE